MTKSKHCIIQVAGMHDLEEAKNIIQAGADYLGFPLFLTVRPPDLTKSEAINIVRALPDTVKPVLITYLNSATYIKKLASILNVKLIQLHGNIALNEIIALKKQLPAAKIIKSIIIKAFDINYYNATIKHFSPYVDAFTTDIYDIKNGACSSISKIHIWEISRHLVEMSPLPVMLAGGLTPENVSEAILTVQPAGVDVHTGVENTTGRKDLGRMQLFVKNARAAFAQINKLTASVT